MNAETTTIHHYTGIEETLNDYDYYILDVWGVIHDGETPYSEAIYTLKRLKKAGKTIFLLSNSSSRLSQLVHHLASMGILAGLYDNALTAGELTYQSLYQQIEPWVQELGPRFFYIGPSNREKLLDGLPYDRVMDHTIADFLIVTGLFQPTHSINYYDTLLQDCVYRKIPLVCANPDLKIVYMSGKERACAGALAKKYADLSGDVYYVGKPYSQIYETCLQQLDRPDPKRIVVIGDGLSTDIQGAHNQNLSSILVLNGVLQGAFNATRELFNFFDQFEIWPDAIINKFIWISNG